MTRIEERLQELLTKQREIETKLENLEVKKITLKENYVRIGQLASERKVYRRELSGINIRIRNVRRDVKQQRKQEITTVAVEVDRQDCQAEEGSDDWDEEDFDPEAVDFQHERPCLRYRPAIPLPHARHRLVTKPAVRDASHTKDVFIADFGQFDSTSDEEIDEELSRRQSHETRVRTEEEVGNTLDNLLEEGEADTRNSTTVALLDAVTADGCTGNISPTATFTSIKSKPVKSVASDAQIGQESAWRDPRSSYRETCCQLPCNSPAVVVIRPKLVSRSSCSQTEQYVKLAAQIRKRLNMN